MGPAPWAIVDFSDADGTPRREVFRDAIEVVAAHDTSEVLAAIERVDTYTRAGRYAVGFLAYEAAPAFEPRFAVRSGYSGPLAWFAIFDRPSGETGHADVADPGEFAWRASVDASEHARAVEEIIEGIRRGDFYQVNYTARLRGPAIVDPLATYERLRRAQGGRYSAFIQTPEMSILSVSPELFFRREGDQVEARPMKGTAARGRWSAEDIAVAEELRASEKERAENVMIVDLVRNDLGRIAIPGTVEVPSLFDVEQYPTVWQMTSHMTSQVKSSTSLASLFGALFPCGSVTGAPKIAASRAIADLETEPRGVYCGAVGIVKPGGNCLFNVAIRTLTIDVDGSATYGAGGGITVDSIPAEEFAELLAKTAVLNAIPDDFDLFETMRLEDGAVERFDRHVARIAASARYFGFGSVDVSIAVLRTSIAAEAASHPQGLYRLRARLSRTGDHSIEIAPFEDSGMPRRIKLATTPVNSGDRLLYHKTTRRAAYTSRLAAVPGVDDVILFNERGELTETTIGNLVLELDGALMTPSLTSGLLPGILREELLVAGEIAESPLPVSALQQCSRVWLINSLRGWVPAFILEST